METDNKKRQEQPIEQLIIDSVIERPLFFAIDDKDGKSKNFYIYQPSLGINLISAELAKELKIDNELMAINPQYEMLRLCNEQKDIVLRIITIHTFQRRSDATKEDKVLSRIKELSNIDTADMSALLQEVFKYQSVQEKLIKHFKIDEEKKQREKIDQAKEQDSSITFGGNSLYGAILDYACERYKWELGYVLWGISQINLNMKSSLLYWLI